MPAREQVASPHFSLRHAIDPCLSDQLAALRGLETIAGFGRVVARDDAVPALAGVDPGIEAKG